MTDEQKKALIEDFKNWTGGWGPEDTSQTQVRKYIRYSLPTTFPKRAACKFLWEEYRKNPIP